MLSLVVTDKSGAQQRLDLDRNEVTIGRSDDNDVCLPRSNVSKHHCRILQRDGRIVLFDLKSTNGTYVNGRRIAAPLVVRRGDKIYVGDFILNVSEGGAAAAVARAATHSHPPTPVVELNDDDPPPNLDDLDESETPSDESAAALEQGLRAAERTIRAPMSSYVDAGGVPDPSASGNLSTPGALPNLAAPRPPREALHALDEVASTRPSRPPVPPPRSERSVPPPPPPPPAPTPGAALPTQPPPPPTAATTPSQPPPLPPAPSKSPSQPPLPNTGRRPSMPPRFEQPDPSQGAATSPAVLSPSVRLQGALGTLMERLGQRMSIEQPTEGAFPTEQLATLEQVLDELEAERVIGQAPDRRFLSEAALSEAVGLGPLDRLLTNRAVREVVVDGPARIVADLGGGLGPVSSFFSSPRAVQLVARRLLARAGLGYSETAPVQEASLPDGTRVQVLQPPLALRGVLLSVRCPPRAPVTADGLVTEGMWSGEMLTVLRGALKARRNVLVIGAAGAGVSRVLGAIASLSPEHERVVLVQQAQTILVDHPQLLQLQRTGAPEVGLGALLGHVQRLRPDRLVVDDIQPGDALALLTHAAAHRGVLMGVHAATAQAGLEQLELFALQQLGGRGGSLAPLLAQAVHLLLEVGAGDDGARRVHSMVEVVQAAGDRLELRPLFRHDGRFRSTEHRASFLSR